jgi:glycosyltransferase involved in cell wall biosynthesis
LCPVIDVIHVMGRMAPGGTEHQLVEMLAVAHGSLWNATLCVLSSEWHLSRQAYDAGVPMVELDGVGRADPRRAGRFRDLAAEAEVIHSSLWGANAFARLAILGRQRPATVISERGVEDNRHLAKRVLDRMLEPATDAFIGNSSAVTGFIRSWHGVAADDPRVFEIRNGLDTVIFHPPDAGSPVPGRALRLVVVGRLIPEKRTDRIISLLPELSKQVDVELMIAGDGPERPRLKAQSLGLPVRFLGHVVSRRELAAVLRSAHVLAMPSMSEGLPNAMIEALACGIRVVAADIPGIRPLAGPGVTLVGDDPRDWAEAILGASRAGPLEASAVGRRVRSFIEVAQDHLSVYEAAMDRHGSRSTMKGRR